MDRILNICLISQEFPPHTHWGGMGVSTYAQAEGYARRGHRVIVVSRQSKGAPPRETREPGFTVYRVGVPILRKRFVGRTLDRVLHARAVARLVRELDRDQRFDVLETAEAGLEGERLLRDPDFVKRMIIHCHGSNAQWQVSGGSLAFLHRLDVGWALRRELDGLARVPHIIVGSQATTRILIQQGVDQRKIVRIYHGIDSAQFHPPISPRMGKLRVGFSGRLDLRKGIDFVWRVVQAVGPEAGIEFHLKGATHRETHADTASRLSKYEGLVVHHVQGPHQDMPDFYRSLDVLLQPSRFETFGLAYAEAMATGLLVLAGEGGAAPEVVQDGVTGFLIDPDGPVDRVVGMLQTMASDREAFSEIRRAARKDVEHRFSTAACVGSKLDLFREVARETYV
jgi:glycosyltransferase involved in cell wall biosynthesis